LKKKHRPKPNERPPSLKTPPAPQARISQVTEYGLLQLVGVLAAVSFVFLLIYAPSLDARFDSRDDHEILRFSIDEKLHPDLPDSFGPAKSVYDLLTNLEQQMGRMRYLYYPLRLAQIAVLGRNAAAWHLVHVGIGILTCFLLYLATRRIGMSWIASGFVVLWTISQEGAGEVWYRLGPSEIYGMLFLSLALFAAAEASIRGRLNFWDGIAFVAAVCMGFSKEPFLLLIPLLVVFRVGFEAYIHERSLRAVVGVTWPASLALTVVFVGQLAAALLAYSQGTYSPNVVSQVEDPYSLRVWSEMFLAGMPRFSYFLPLAAALGTALWSVIRRARPNWWILGAALLALGVYASQLPLLKASWSGNRYFYPAAFGVALLSGIALDTVRNRWLFSAVAVASLVAAVPAGLQTFALSSEFAGHTIALNRMFDTAEAEAVPGRALVIYANPNERFEQSISAVGFLGYRGVRTPVYLYPSGKWMNSRASAEGNMAGQFPNRVDESDLDGDFLEEFESRHGRRPGKALSADDVGALVILHSLDVFESAPPSWYNPADWSIRRFREGCWVARGFRLRWGGSREHIAAVKRTR
jgi:hypothetical protein